MTDQTQSQSSTDAANETPSIDLRENGPLLLKHGSSITLEDGSVEEVKAAAPLCRCGASANKPFCDGAHRAIGYVVDDTPKPQAARNYSGDTSDGNSVTISYNKLLCSHAAQCVKLGDGVFDSKRRPWIDPSQSSLDAVRAAVQGCPSGALRIAEGEAEHDHLANQEVSVKVTKNGPYEVTNIPIAAAMPAEGQTESNYVLCRCGLTGNAPFCDGTHSDENWSADAVNGAP